MKTYRVVAFACALLVSLCLVVSGQTFSHASGSPYASGGTAPNSLAVADFNADGALDVLVANSGSVGASSSNYTGRLGLLSSGKPNGALGTSAGLAMFNVRAGARAINVANRRAAAGTLVFSNPFVPAVVGGTLDTVFANAAAYNNGNFVSQLSTTGLGTSGSAANPSGGYTYWGAGGDFNGEGIDGAAVTFVNSPGATTSLNYVTVMFSSTFAAENIDVNSALVLTMPVGLLAKRVFVADVNRDGKADIVVTTGGTEVVVFLSQSTVAAGITPHALAFAAPLTINILHPSEFVTIADADGDGKVDLVVSTGVQTLDVIPGNGDGTFGAPFYLALPTGVALSAAVGDFNHDGIPDIAVASGDSPAGIYIWAGRGSASYQSAVSADSGGHAVWVVAADMNADGKPDLVVANSAEATVAVLLNSTQIILPGPSSLTFYASVGGSNPPGQFVFVAYDGGSGTPTYLATPTPSGSWLSVNPSASGSSGPLTVSVNPTGLAAGTYQGSVQIADTSNNLGTVSVTFVVAGPTGTLVRQAPGVSPGTVLTRHGDIIIAAGDFTGHGRMDLVGVSYSGGGDCVSSGSFCFYTYPNNGDGTFGAEVNNVSYTLTNFYPGFAAVGDFNGDGKLDFAAYTVGNAGTVRVFFGDGAGHFTMGRDSYSVGGIYGAYNASITDIKAADLNNDGKLDLLVATNIGSDQQFTSGSVTVLINNGNGTFNIPNVVNLTGARFIATGDFNRDGILDMVVGSLFGGVSYFRGTGGGFFAAPTTVATSLAVQGASGNGSLDIVVGDFDKDGRLDLVIGWNSPGKLTTYLGNGNGTFTLLTNAAVVGTPLDLQLADFNGDGNLDLVLHRAQQGSFTVMLGDGAGLFPTSVDFNSGYSSSSTSHIYAADFSGDGKFDVVVPDPGTWTIWLGDKAATTTAVSSNPLTSTIIGQSVTYSATITATAPAWAVPTGTVTVSDDNPGGVLASGSPTAGVYSTNQTASPAGTHHVSAAYAGDSRTKPSNDTASPYTFTVNSALLSFSTQPADTPVGIAMANVVVQVLNPSTSLPWASYTGPVALTLSAHSFAAGSTTTVNAVAGVATFSNLKINTTGNYTITASLTSLFKVSNSFTITAGPVSQLVVAGFANPATAGTASNFTVTAQDAGGNTVTNYTGTIHFTSSDGTATLPANYTFVAGDNGVHTFSGTLRTVGTQSITATDTVTASITGAQTSIVVQAGAPATLTPNNTPQSKVVGGFYTTPSVTLTDAAGNPISGATILFTTPNVVTATGTFTSPAHSASGLTNGSGIASSQALQANTVTGTFNVTACVVQTPPSTCYAAAGLNTTFAMTNTPDVVAHVTIQTGDSQSTAINTAFGATLTALVTDQYSNPIPNQSVTFTMPGSGASAAFPAASLTSVVNTNASGVATAATPLTANSTVGKFTPTVAAGAITTNYSGLTNLAGAPAHLTITAGNNQNATVNTAFATQFVAHVTDSGGNPIAGAVVSFTAPNSGASGTFPGALLTVNATATDASGNTTAPVFTANTTAGGPYNVAASLNALTANVALTNNPGAAVLTINGGNNQSAAISAAFTTALSAKVADSFGNPYSGVSVVFTAPGSGASGTFSNATNTITVSTLATGIASAAFTANATVGGPYTVTGASAGLTTVNFSETNNSGPPASVTITGSGTPQSTVVNTAFANALSVKVADAGSNPLSGVNVVFLAPAAGASGVFSNSTNTITVATNASGIASAPVSANTIANTASYNVTATVTGLPSATFVLTNTPGAGILSINGGNNQSAVVSVAFATALSAKVADSFGNPISGVSVVFTAPAAGASGVFSNSTNTITVATLATGIASATFTANATVGGPYTVSAASTGLTTVNFSEANTLGPPANVTITGSGTPQSTIVNTAFANALSVKVTDTGLNPISGVNVVFLAPAAGASGVFSNSTNTITVATNGSGIASAPVSANTTAGGPYNVTATVTGLPAATFALTNTPGAGILSINAGNNQSAVVSSAFSTALSAKVADSFGNLISGVSVIFTAPAAGASGVFSNSTNTITVATLASGIASASFTANATVGGPYTVSAASAGLTTVNFSESNIAGSPAHIAVSGTPQSVVVGNAYGALSATVTDAANNPISGVIVTFSVQPAANGASGAFGGAVAVATNASGVAAAPAFTANTVAGVFTVKATAGLLVGTFNLTNLPGPPAKITPSGSGQSAVINTQYAPFSVQITDASNNPISGLSVNFNANVGIAAGGLGQDALSAGRLSPRLQPGPTGSFPGGVPSATVVTDANGNAVAPTFTANGSIGGFTVTGVSGSLNTTFNFTNILNPPSQLIIVSGSPQNAQPGSVFGLPVTVKVVNSSGAPISNLVLTFSLPSSGPSATFAGGGLTFSGTSNASGLVTTPALTAGATQGNFAGTVSTGSLQASFPLSVGSLPSLTVEPTGMLFTYYMGLTPPAPQTANVFNANGSFFAVSDAPWDKAVVLSNGGFPFGVSVSVDPTGLAAGTYSSNIAITPAGSTQSVSLRVTLVVVPKPQIGSGPTSLTFRYVKGGALPPVQTVSTIALSRNVSFSLATQLTGGSNAFNWLNVVAANNATTTPAILNVSVAPATLDPGTYQGVVQVVTPDATNSPYSIPVTLVVIPANITVIPPVITAIVNAASFQNGSVSGNEILAMFGTNLACATGGGQVLVDGVPALVLGGTANQVNWVAPDLTGRTRIQVQFACGTNVSDAWAMPVTTVVPGIFTADGKQVSAFDAGTNWVVNGPNAPIARGQIVMLFGTGFGPLNPADANGLQTQIVPVTVTVGGIPATLTFAGAAPGLPGVNQINVIIPANAPTGAAVPIIVSAGSSAVPGNLTVAVN